MSKDLIVGVETSGLLCSVAFQQDGKLLYEASVERANVHGAILAELVSDGLKKIDAKTSDLKMVASSAGPGSFTGLRIGMSYAKGLAFGCDIPLVAVSNYEILRSCAPAETKKCCTVIDARRGRYYSHFFVDKEEKEFDAGTTNWKNLLPQLDTQTVLVAEKYVAEIPEEIIKSCKTMITGIRMRAGLLCDCAEKKYELGDYLPVDVTEPLYLQPFAGVL